MNRWMMILSLAILVSRGGRVGATDYASGAPQPQTLEIHDVTVEDKPVTFSREGRVRLRPFPKNISFSFGPATNSTRNPVRLRYKLEGYDSAWRENDGAMTLTARFYDVAGDQVGQKIFDVSGDSAGWKGGLKNSPLTHRRENITVPPKASRLWIVISSAGPPSAVGVFVVDDLMISKISTNSGTQVLLRSPFEHLESEDLTNRVPEGWIRDGTHPSMAKIMEIGESPGTKAFAILDDDPTGHAEWHNIMEYAPQVTPGDHLVVEWNEMFSLGTGNIRAAHYDSLPPGQYQFQVAEVTAMGVPTGDQAALALLVPLPFWRAPWFWMMTFVVSTLMLLGAARYLVRRRLRMEMVRLEQQRALEQERLRIAHDIHDDLGARVTQISLLSALAHDNPAFPEKARGHFDQISRMSRELVSALYQTVWAVNPENDNLDALGNYLCQMVNQLCDQGQLRCRLHVQELPGEILISSQTRHNISLAVKEAVHNAIKHARASEITMRITLAGKLLTVSVQDDGCGFLPADSLAGNGLTNMKCRMENIGGSCTIESQPGRGTTVQLRQVLRSAGQERQTGQEKL